jgi:hypothetical protein
MLRSNKIKTKKSCYRSSYIVRLFSIHYLVQEAPQYSGFPPELIQEMSRVLQ